MKNKSSNSALLRRAIVNSVSAVGLKTSEIKFHNNRIEIPSCGVIVSLVLEQGKRVWKAEHTYSVMRLEDAFENRLTTQLFTVPLEEDLLLARRLALHIAINRIDAALDATLSESSGRLQS